MSSSPALTAKVALSSAEVGRVDTRLVRARLVEYRPGRSNSASHHRAAASAWIDCGRRQIDILLMHADEGQDVSSWAIPSAPAETLREHAARAETARQ